MDISIISLNFRLWCFNWLLFQGFVWFFSRSTQDRSVDWNLHADHGIPWHALVQHTRQAQDDLDRSQWEADCQWTKIQGGLIQSKKRIFFSFLKLTAPETKELSHKTLNMQAVSFLSRAIVKQTIINFKQKSFKFFSY
jgi:hypothetical protein